MKNKNSKLTYFLFGFLLFLLVGFSCVKPVTTSFLRDTYIAPAFSNRLNTIIERACPELDFDERMKLQNMIHTHPQLNPLIHRYLCAYADFINGNKRAIRTVDNDKAFAVMNQDILDELKRRNPGSSLAFSDDEYFVQMTEREEAVEEILDNIISDDDIRILNSHSMNILIIAALEIYRIATAWWMQILLLLLLGLLISPLFVTYSKKFCSTTSRILVIQGCFWAVILPVLFKLIESKEIYILGRILGYHMFIYKIPFIWRGGVLIVIGILMLILKKYIISAPPQ